MDYISVKQASEKFGISERRIQKLCETKRINGSTMLSGVWLIPADAKKPADERKAPLPDGKDYLSLKDLCNTLSISTATGKNWLKLGKIFPEYTNNEIPFFSKKYVTQLKNDISSGKNSALKSRRNKKYVSGNALYNSYVSDNSRNLSSLQELLNFADDNSIEFNSTSIQYIIADCALHLFAQKEDYTFINDKNLLYKFLKNDITINSFDELISSLIDDKNDALSFCEKYSSIFEIDYFYEENEDILGLIYISCKNIGNRKATGSYYTPTKVVKKLISNLTFSTTDKILDPCCGTGNFLLQLPEDVSFRQVYGNDIDSISVKITRLNMALKYDNVSISEICEHITEKNFLNEYSKTEFNFIIGNPPWGYEFSEDEKSILRTTFKSAIGKNIESYDIFIEKSLESLTLNGTLSFVLPEAILNVKAHSPIRKIIMENNSISYLEFLGNAFDGVQCPCIILQAMHTKTNLDTMGMKVVNKADSFVIQNSRNVSPEYFSFSLNDNEYEILDKIENVPNCVFLKDNADFALGLVTGNNKKYIIDEQKDLYEVVLKGSNIYKYKIVPDNNFILFRPHDFQQVAPIEYYRAPEKLLYRFISNQLVFAYDDKKTLSLNSCNILIPRLKDLNIKYIMAILNSRIAQFLFSKKFQSVKVLRAHIENIPIPNIDKEKQKKIMEKVNLLCSSADAETESKIYNEIDLEIAKLFSITKEEYSVILESGKKDNIFLY